MVNVGAVNIVILIVGVLIAIAVHEFGHFAVAKLAKVKVFEFSVGLGPKILKKRRRGTLYALRLIPLGGYVLVASKLLTEELQKTGEDQYKGVKESELLESKKPWVRILFFLGGIITNIAFSSIMALLIDYLVYGQLVIGIIFERSFQAIDRVFTEVFTGQIFSRGGSQVSGIVGSSIIIAQQPEILWTNFYAINLSLVAFNLLPIPPLDGFKILETIFTSYIYKKPIPRKLTMGLNIGGAIFIGLLILLLLISDIVKNA